MANYGIYEKALISDNLENSLNYARGSGYTFWEISIDKSRKGRLYWDDESIKRMADVCLKTDMPIYNMVLSIHRDYPLGSYDGDIREKGLEYLFRAIDLAVKLGIRTIQLAGYYTSAKEAKDGSIEVFTESLIAGAKYAAANGVMLGIENMDYDLTSVEDIISVVNKVNNPYLNYFLDVGNFMANELNPLKELKEVIPYLVGLHLKETNKGIYRRVDFGRGIVPFKQIFELLKKNGYDGYFGVEMWNDDDSESLNKISDAIKWLDNLRQ